MLNKKYIILIILFNVLINRGFAQLPGADVKDFQAWASVEVSYKLNKKWTFKLEEQLRLKNDAKITDQYFTELYAEYSPFKKIEFAIGARYISENDTQGSNQGYESYFRFNIDGTYKYKIDRFSLKHRLRYQNKNKLGEDDNPIINTRLKTSIAYNIKSWKLDPKISGEIFRRYEKDEDTRFNKYRLTLETEYKINKIGAISIFYRLDKEINIINAETLKILGLKFSYNF